MANLHVLCTMNITYLQGNTLAQGVYGNKLNNAGEYLSVGNSTGEVMIFTDSDTNGGFGFLKLTPKQLNSSIVRI